MGLIGLKKLRSKSDFEAFYRLLSSKELFDPESNQAMPDQLLEKDPFFLHLLIS
jgi:hypothetical protein